MARVLRGASARVLYVAVSFCLYRSAATYLYNSGLGLYSTSVGFVSSLGFVFAMNVAACATSVVILLLLRLRRCLSAMSSPWPAFVVLLLGTIGARALSPLTDEGSQLVAGIACGAGLTSLCVLWLGVFAAQAEASTMLAEVTLGYALYTGLFCLSPLLSTAQNVVTSLLALAVSSLLVQRDDKSVQAAIQRQGRLPGLSSYREAPTYICFFVLTGVVGLLHTSVLGSTFEPVVGSVSMWEVRLLSLLVFAAIVALMGSRFSPTRLFEVVFPTLIAVLTLLPFIGPALGALTGTVSIFCYVMCGMVFYLFLVRETRRLGASCVFMGAVYTFGSSGTLLVGLATGLALQAISASTGLSLLTMLAFVAIYPLALVFMVLLRRDAAAGQRAAASGGGSGLGTRAQEGDGPAQPEQPDRSASLSSRATAEIARRYGLTNREREVMGYLAEGRSVRYIAETLVISENTAWTHAKRIYAKTGTHGKQEVIDLVNKTVRALQGQSPS